MQSFDIPILGANLNNASSLEDDDNYNYASSDKTSGASLLFPLTAEEIRRHEHLKSTRIAQRRERAREIIANHRPEPEQLYRMSSEEIRRVYGNAVREDPELEGKNHRWLRGLGNTNYYGSHVPNFMAPVDQYYDPWAQAYRMLGGYIDCDHAKENNGKGSHDQDRNGNKNKDNNSCSRWMMWAAVSVCTYHILLETTA
jgi:hypothetical protein